MAAQPRRIVLPAITWKIALLPLMAIVAAAAAELTAYEPHSVPGVAVHAATFPTPVPVQGATATTQAPAPHFLAPAGVAVRGTEVYMSDVPTNAIWAYDSATKVTTLITGSLGPGYSGDGGPAAEAQLMGPRGLALDAAGNLFIADSGNHAIRRIAAADGTISTVAGTGSRGFSGDGGPATRAHLNTPDGVAFDASGNLYIADTLNQRIRKVNRAGTIITVAGSGAISTVGHSTGGFGFSGDGGPAVYAQLSIPEGVAVDGRGNVYIADTGNDRIRRVDTKGIIRTVAGTGNNPYSGDGGPAVRANLYAPVGIAIGLDGSVYFSERYQQTVRLITARGLLVLVAGRGGSRGGTGDGGYAVRARLNDPQGIAFGPGGELYIADTGNHRIRMVSPDRTITSMA